MSLVVPIDDCSFLTPYLFPLNLPLIERKQLDHYEEKMDDLIDLDLFFILTGSKGWRSPGRDFTWTFDSGSFVDLHSDPVGGYCRPGRLVAAL